MTENRIRRSGRALCLVLLVAMLLALFALPRGAAASAKESAEPHTRAKISYTLPGIPGRDLGSYKRLALTVNRVNISGGAPIINGIAYLPLRAFAEAVGGASVSYNASTKTATLKMSGLYLTVSDGAFVAYANDRALFSFSPAIMMTNGKMYVPAEALAKALGLKRDYISESALSYSGKYTPLIHAAKYYRADEVLWLSRIISAEARGESLIGQIAVGNVIMNRVRSSAFPNTIWGVIFDKRYGIQFSPVANGTVYNDPTYTATLAAKICLEGTSLSGDTLYFLNPRVAHSSWIVNNRRYAYTIINHDFYY